MPTKAQPAFCLQHRYSKRSFQLAYLFYHKTKTVLLKVVNDLFSTLGDKNISVLTLHNLSIMLLVLWLQQCSTNFIWYLYAMVLLYLAYKLFCTNANQELSGSCIWIQVCLSMFSCICFQKWIIYCVKYVTAALMRRGLHLRPLHITRQTKIVGFFIHSS